MRATHPMCTFEGEPYCVYEFLPDASDEAGPSAQGPAKRARQRTC